MKTYAELDDVNLHWETHGLFKRRHELKDDTGEIWATITQPSAFRSDVEVDAPGNRWRFKPRGFFQRSIIIESIGTGAQIAEYKHRGNKLIFSNGRIYRLKQRSFTGGKWMWLTEDGTPVVGFRTYGVFRFRSNVDVDTEIADEHAVALLIYLGWYLIDLRNQQVAAMAAAGA